MFCKNCGDKIKKGAKFCAKCGEVVSLDGNKVIEKKTEHANFSKSKLNLRAIVVIVIIVVVIGLNIYYKGDDEAVTSNEVGLELFDKGGGSTQEAQQAIDAFKEASESAVSPDVQIEVLKNLSYAYSAEGRTYEAIEVLKEALKLADSNSLNYYLINGDIAYLEARPNSALLNYNEAYNVDPNDFQANNALGIFYLDLEEIAPAHTDYQKALQYTKRAYELSGLETVKENMAMAYLFSEDYDTAIALYLSLNPSNKTYLYLWLAIAHYGKEDFVNGDAYVRKALDAGMEVPQELLDIYYF